MAPVAGDSGGRGGLVLDTVDDDLQPVVTDSYQDVAERDLVELETGSEDAVGKGADGQRRGEVAVGQHVVSRVVAVSGSVVAGVVDRRASIQFGDA